MHSRFRCSKHLKAANALLPWRRRLSNDQSLTEVDSTDVSCSTINTHRNFSGDEATFNSPRHSDYCAAGSWVLSRLAPNPRFSFLFQLVICAWKNTAGCINNCMPLTFLTQGRGHNRCTSDRCTTQLTAKDFCFLAVPFSSAMHTIANLVFVYQQEHTRQWGTAQSTT